jgi:hypothetical protein
MSFAAALEEQSIITAKAIQDVQMKKFREFEKEKAIREDELMKNLTIKYHTHLKFALLNAAILHGRREKYINFDYNDFKANFPELGKPKDVCRRWLNHMTDELSEYLPIREPNPDPLDRIATFNRVDDGLIERDHFAGISFDIWNNRSFTVHFKW